MIYDKDASSVPPEDLPLVMLRRAMELAMVAGFGGAVGPLVVFLQLPLTNNARMVALSSALAVLLVLEGLAVLCWWAPPKAYLRMFERTCESGVRRGKPVRIISRPFVFMLGALALVVCFFVWTSLVPFFRTLLIPTP